MAVCLAGRDLELNLHGYQAFISGLLGLLSSIITDCAFTTGRLQSVPEGATPNASYSKNCP